MTIPRFRPRTLRWRVILLVGGFLLLLLTTATVATVARFHVSDVGSRVREVLRPAQIATAGLGRAYVDMETGERGFQLTRDPEFLKPYDSGREAAAAARDRLGQLLGDDPGSVAILADIDAAGEAWRTRVAEPGIALAGRGGAVTNEPSTALFDTLRTRLGSLENHVNALVAAGLASSSGASTTANVTTAVCVGLALVLGLVAAFLVRRSLVVPLDRLVSQVREVSGGELHREVEASGPGELAELGTAVEAMRVRILSETEQVAASAHRIARLEETDRIARSLGDTAIRRLYGITLDLQSAAARFPRSGPVMATAITGIDRTISALRTSVYGSAPAGTPATLRAQVSEVVGELETTRGAAPGLLFTGHLSAEPPVDVVAELVQVLRELLHAATVPGGGAEEAELALADAAITLRVVAAGRPGVREALAGVREGVVVRVGPDRVTAEWRRPLPGSGPPGKPVHPSPPAPPDAPRR
ncbi:hypothetical protein GCM10027445_16250 [Amycolatopsis endophytica]|uniref:CHASE3 domain sensor protein n=1 Tax=Amycolatopsis endophytica TaxID=860233 RepID=A0A853B5Z8_9PSEU|nr:CHASE3 domain-containing protein [Amycolatopsis endophytica]NYI90161.1 CHASE3 domain sensor protein [Amycolatopsis endophytica]